MRSVVFVHGTGVRTQSYSQTFARIRNGLAGADGVGEVRGCFWGEAQGARLVLDGKSVPGFAETGGSRAQDRRRADEDAAAWSVLYGDPWHELRLLGLLRPAGAVLGPGAEPPSDALRRALAGYTPGPELAPLLEEHGLTEHFASALHELRASPEFREAARTAGPGSEHRSAVARALVAATLASAVESGRDAPAGEVRDAVLDVLVADLHADARSMSGRLLKIMASPLVHSGTWYARHRRGKVSETSLPAIGDILKYQARGQGLRSQIRRTVEDAPGDAVTLIAHSLGGVACVDLLAMERVPRVDQLITVGSQAPFFYESGALVSTEHPASLPGHFPSRWLNILDPRDLLSFAAEPVFPEHARDMQVDNGQPFPFAHSAYWSNSAVWKAIRAWLS